MEIFDLTQLLAPATGSGDLAHEPARLIGLFIAVVFVALYVRGRIVAVKAKPTVPPALAKIERLIDEAIEDGRPLHVGPGTGALGGALTAETLAGLRLARHVSTRLAAGGVSTLRSSPDPVAFATLTGRGRAPFLAQAVSGLGGTATFVPDRAAYAMEVMGIVGAGALGANVLAGAFGDEYLLIAHAGHEAGVPLIAGSGSLGALPILAVTTDTPLLGEELFNAGPLLAGGTSQIATLFAQDGIRVLTVAGLIALALARSIGVL